MAPVTSHYTSKDLPQLSLNTNHYYLDMVSPQPAWLQVDIHHGSFQCDLHDIVL